MSFRLAVPALALCCACHDDAIHTYRVVFPVSALPGEENPRTLLPEACYQPASLPHATAPEQQAAESFCAIGKRPSTGAVSTNIVKEEEWALFDNAEGEEYLVRRSASAGTETGLVGRRQGNSLVFASATVSYGSTCPGHTNLPDSGFFPTQDPVIEVCDGKCVNINADPAHCGACGFACPNGFACTFGRCQTTCGGGFFITCNGQQIDTSSDRNHCGQCNNPCPPGTVCAPSFGFSGPGQCMRPCEAQCARDSLSEGCGPPAYINRELNTLIELTVSGDALTGQLTQGLSYSCDDGGCAADFGSRCPSCSVALQVNGRLESKAQEAAQK